MFNFLALPEREFQDKDNHKVKIRDQRQESNKNSRRVPSDDCKRKKRNECSHEDARQEMRLPPRLSKETEDATPVQTSHDGYRYQTCLAPGWMFP